MKVREGLIKQIKLVPLLFTTGVVYTMSFLTLSTLPDYKATTALNFYTSYRILTWVFKKCTCVLSNKNIINALYSSEQKDWILSSNKI